MARKKPVDEQRILVTKRGDGDDRTLVGEEMGDHGYSGNPTTYQEYRNAKHNAEHEARNVQARLDTTHPQHENEVWIESNLQADGTVTPHKPRKKNIAHKANVPIGQRARMRYPASNIHFEGIVTDRDGENTVIDTQDGLDLVTTLDKRVVDPKTGMVVDISDKVIEDELPPMPHKVRSRARAKKKNLGTKANVPPGHKVRKQRTYGDLPKDYEVVTTGERPQNDELSDRQWVEHPNDLGGELADRKRIVDPKTGMVQSFWLDEELIPLINTDPNPALMHGQRSQPGAVRPSKPKKKGMDYKAKRRDLRGASVNYLGDDGNMTTGNVLGYHETGLYMDGPKGPFLVDYERIDPPRATENRRDYSEENQIYPEDHYKHLHKFLIIQHKQINVLSSMIKSLIAFKGRTPAELARDGPYNDYQGTAADYIERTRSNNDIQEAFRREAKLRYPNREQEVDDYIQGLDNVIAAGGVIPDGETTVSYYGLGLNHDAMDEQFNQ